MLYSFDGSFFVVNEEFIYIKSGYLRYIFDKKIHIIDTIIFENSMYRN